LTVLVIESGPGAGQRIELSGELVLGREEGFVLDDPSCSRRHARLYLDQHGVVVEDLGSSNGTWVNGQRIAGPTRLSPGDQLYLGSTTLMLEAPVAQVAQPAAAPQVDVFAPLEAGVSRQIASRRPVPTVLTFATIAATAAALVAYFAGR
jgi:ABC transport system ATP-binding/permease protein